MAIYVTLVNFTDQGVRNVKDTPKRAEAFKAMAKKHGVTVKDIYWTQGRYDIITITEAADDMAATALSLSIAGEATFALRPCGHSLRPTCRPSSERWLSS